MRAPVPVQLLSEFVATLGLLAAILACAARTREMPWIVGAYIAAAYWFTGSTSFANPAVTLARSVTDTFAGIRPADVPGFVTAQLAGGAAALGLWRFLSPSSAPRDVKRVIFACVHNAGRSQMAAALFNASADPARAVALSAGTEPADRVHPEVVAAMREVGIDLAGALPTRLTGELAAGASLLVTMGCGEACPFVPGLRREDWPLEDPKGKSIEGVRAVRDEIRRRVLGLLRAEGWERSGG